MKWIIQETLNNGSSNYLRIRNALEDLCVDYLIINLTKDGNLLIVDKIEKTFLDDCNQLFNNFVSKSKIMAYGSKNFAILAGKLNLIPGTFLNDNFDFTVLIKHFGKELLNHEFIIDDLFNIEPKWDYFFIRPTGNTKLFTGMKVNLSDFNEWKIREKSLIQSDYDNHTLMISPIKKINAEYRFFIVDNVIVSCSSYSVEDKFNISLLPSKCMVDYVKRMISIFPLSRAYVIDIAETPEGYKIVEFNNINSSGLYGCDEYEIIKAINNMIYS